MGFPGSGLHLLEPKKKGRWAVRVSENWRITFRFEGGDAYEADYEDYLCGLLQENVTKEEV